MKNIIQCIQPIPFFADDNHPVAGLNLAVSVWDDYLPLMDDRCNQNILFQLKFRLFKGNSQLPAIVIGNKFRGFRHSPGKLVQTLNVISFGIVHDKIPDKALNPVCGYDCWQNRYVNIVFV